MKSSTLHPQVEKSKERMACLYARVSSQQQKEEETIDSQVHALLQFANSHEYQIPKDWIFIDEGYTGVTSDRPGLDRLRDLVREFPIDTILIYSPDRLARKYALQLVLEEEFNKFGVKVVYYNEGKTVRTPEEEMLRHFQGIFAEYERTQILERTKRGKLYKARQGNANMLPRAPFGYYKDRGALFYTVKENEAQVVKKIFHLFIKEKMKLREIAKYLEEKGISAPQGGLKWNSKTIQGILKNTAYTGTAYFGKTEKAEGNTARIARYKTRGKVVKPLCAKKKRPMELWEPISVPQFINENDFEIAQELLKKNREFSRRNTTEPSILQGLTVCGLCGHSYYKKSRGSSKSRKYVYYMCRSSLVKGITKCNNRKINQGELDKCIWDNIIELLKNPQLIEEEINRRANENPQTNQIDQRRKELEAQIKQIEKSSNKLLDAYQEGDCLSLEELKKRSKNLREKHMILKQEISSLDAFLIKKNNCQGFKDTLEFFRKSIENSYLSLSVDEKQKVIRALIEDIVIFPNEIEVRHTIPTNESRDSLLCGANVE